MPHNPHSHSHHTTTSSPYPRRSLSPTYTISNPNPFYLKQEISELKSCLVDLESSFETRLNNLETNYETRFRTLESELESRLRDLEMGYEDRMRGLKKNYESVLEFLEFQRGVAQQDGVMKSFLGKESEDSEFFSFWLFLNYLCSFTHFRSFVCFFWQIVVYTLASSFDTGANATANAVLFFSFSCLFKLNALLTIILLFLPDINDGLVMR